MLSYDIFWRGFDFVPDAIRAAQPPRSKTPRLACMHQRGAVSKRS
jgi:hypothetical protein